jgi:hypothetical protein
MSEELVTFVNDNNELCFCQGSIVRLLIYQDSNKSYYVDFTSVPSMPKSVEFDGTVESLKTIIKGVYSRLV